MRDEDTREERTRRRAALQRRYRRLLMQLPAPVLVLEHGRIRLANRAAVALLGVSASAQLRGLSYNDLLLSTSAVSGGGEHHKLRRRDSIVIDVEALMQGPPQHRVVVLRDLSRLLSTENALRRSEARFRLMAENLRDRAIITLDAVGYIVHWNDAATHVTGYISDQTIGKPFSMLFTDEASQAQNHESLLREAIEKGRSEQEGWLQRADASHYYASISAVGLKDRDRKVNGFVVMLRDLSPNTATEVLRNEEQMRQAQRMEAVGRLASGIAHDFNNLLTAIHGHAQFLLEDLPGQSPSIGDAEEILRSADRAAALTSQLLAFSRGQTMQPQTIDLNKAVTAMERLLRRVITENIELRTDLDPKLAPVCADPSQIEQVLVNLVVNARDAMPDGGTVTIETSNAALAATLQARHEEVGPGKYVLLSVTDTGIGMDAVTQEHIFEPFFTTKDAGRGTGLGLSTVYGIVRQSGGHIFCYSEPGQGTTFKIYLPTATVPPVPETPERKMRHQALENETVLIIEDDESVRALARRVLQARGYQTLMASTWQEAIKHIRDSNATIALVVSDVVLPDANGTSLVETIHETRPDTPVLLMSGYTADHVRSQNLISDEQPFIEKPFTPDALARKVREVIDASLR